MNVAEPGILRHRLTGKIFVRGGVRDKMSQKLREKKNMKCQGRFVKFFAVLLIGLAGFQLSLTAMDKAVTHPELQTVGFKCLPHYPPAMPSEMIKNSFHAENSNPMQRIIQLILILFFISPPLIVVLLFLIWCELRKRNKPE